MAEAFTMPTMGTIPTMGTYALETATPEKKARIAAPSANTAAPEKKEEHHSYAPELRPGEAPYTMNLVVLMISDAIHNQTGQYFIDKENKMRTTWQRGQAAREVGLFLRQTWVSNAMSSLATLDLFLACLTWPGVDMSVGFDLAGLAYPAYGISIMIWLIFCLFCGVRTFYMWDMRKYWAISGLEPRWLIGMIVVLYILTPAAIISGWTSGNHHILQGVGVLEGSKLECPNAFKVSALGLCRAWCFVYFNPSVRKALVVLIKVISKLGPFAALTTSCFTAHFFVFQALAYNVWPDDGQAGKNGYGYGGSTGDAVYNLFGLMTTVNHPDVFMWLVDKKWFTMIVIMSFIFFTMILAQNLLLGFVYGEYCEALEERLVYDAKLRSAMVDAAYDIAIQIRIAEGGAQHNYLTNSELLYILRKCDRTPIPLDNEDGDIVEMIVRLIDNKAITRIDKIDEGSFKSEGELLQDDQIDRADVHELIVFYNIGYKIKSLKQLDHRRMLTLAQMNKQIKSTPHQTAKDELVAEGEFIRSHTKEYWAATFPDFYRVAYEYGADVDFLWWWPWHTKSLMAQCHVMWFIIYLVLSIVDTGIKHYTSTLSTLQLVSAIIQTIFITVTFLGDMRKWETFHFFNPNSRNATENYTSILLFLSLWMSFLGRCTSGGNGCFGDILRNEMTKFDIGMDTLSKIFQVMNFAVMTPSVQELLHVVYGTMGNIGPHLGLFIAAYFTFAGAGIGMFCGLTGQAVSEGGPGDWTSTSVLSKGTGVPWASTAYGSSANYINNLNFNGFIHSFYALYVIMIQNNWTTVVNGPIEVTNKYNRWFFIAYNLVISFVMMNIVVGAIVDSLCLIRDEIKKNADPQVAHDTLAIICEARLNCTKAPSGKYYSQAWSLQPLPIHGDVRFDADLVPLFDMSEQACIVAKKTYMLEREVEVMEAEIQDYESSLTGYEHIISAVEAAEAAAEAAAIQEESSTRAGKAPAISNDLLETYNESFKKSPTSPRGPIPKIKKDSEDHKAGSPGDAQAPKKAAPPAPKNAPPTPKKGPATPKKGAFVFDV